MPEDVLWNPASNKVYTANHADGTVTIIDGATNLVRATVAVADDPNRLCWNSVGNKVYCISHDPDWLSVIDGAGDTLLRRVRMRGCAMRTVYNELMNKLYVVCFDDCMVRVYDGGNEALVAEVSFGDLNSPYTLLWHPGSNRVFCTTSCGPQTDTVFVVDCVSDEIVERRPAGSYPYAMCRAPTNGLVYVGTRNGILVLSADGGAVLDTIPAYAADMCFVPCPNKIYAVTHWTVVIDCDRNVVIESLPFRGNEVLCDTVHRKVYSASVNVSRLYIYDGQADSLLTTIQLPFSSDPSLAWNSTNSRVYIPGEGVVYVIRDTSTAVAEPVADAGRSTRRLATICRGRLWLEGDGPASLLNPTGRQVMRLEPGDNDLRGLRAGVYFVVYKGSYYATKVILQDSSIRGTQ